MSEPMNLLEVEKFVANWDFAQRNGGSRTANLALLRDRIYALQFPAPSVQASEARGVNLSRRTLSEIISRTAIESVNKADWAGNCADAILAHLQQAPQVVGEWIPVTERLPDSSENVLCYVFDLGRFIGYYVSDEGWVREPDSEPIDIVTHWQPLPSFPRSHTDR